MPRHLVAVLVLAGALAACATYTRVDPGRVAVKGALTVQAGTAWAKVNRATSDSVLFADSGEDETWTIDGEPLESLMFFAGIRDGQPLMILPSEKGPLAPFNAKMSPNDVMDLFEAMLTKVTGSVVAQSHNLRPARVGNMPGFRFEVDYTMKDDVDRTLSAAGAVKDGKLYVIAFQGTRLYHYKKYLPEFENIVASAAVAHS
jgi:hypothetical protein